jgi:hypothetical protein
MGFGICELVSISAKTVTGVKRKETEKGVRHFHDTELVRMNAIMLGYLPSQGEH